MPQTGDRSFDINRLQQFKGASEAVVIDEIGPPTYRITDNQADYLVYEGLLDTTGIIFMFWIPVAIESFEEETLDCIRLEFKEDALQNYEVKTRSTTYHWRLHDCRKLFWSAENPEQIDPYTGATQAKLESTFGKPNWLLMDNKTTYLVYQYSHPIRNACVLLEFGEENTLRRYEIKSCGLTGEGCPTHPAGDVDWGYLDCRQLFWTLEQLEKLVPEDIERSIWNSAEAMRLEQVIGIYCQRADLGDADAQHYLGDLYFLGKDGVGKDLIRAYVWYSLAASNGSRNASELARVVENELSPLQLDKARRLFDEWKPGHCKRDIMQATHEGNE